MLAVDVWGNYTCGSVCMNMCVYGSGSVLICMWIFKVDHMFYCIHFEDMHSLY